jgi:hypothetical protein
MRKIAAILLFVLALSPGANAQYFFIPQGGFVPTKSVVTTCTNKLDFSQPCNSQYLFTLGLI